MSQPYVHADDSESCMEVQQAYTSYESEICCVKRRPPTCVAATWVTIHGIPCWSIDGGQTPLLRTELVKLQKAYKVVQRRAARALARETPTAASSHATKAPRRRATVTPKNSGVNQPPAGVRKRTQATSRKRPRVPAEDDVPSGVRKQATSRTLADAPWLTPPPPLP